MNIQGLVHVNIDRSRFERSRAFYEMLGLEVLLDVPETNTPEGAAVAGFSEYKFGGALMVLRSARPPIVIDLLDWQTPVDSAAPYAQLNNLGIARIARSFCLFQGSRWDRARIGSKCGPFEFGRCRRGEAVIKPESGA